ncbi:MAG TPA: Vms1/Ankzf1 family peptidyl-tRNA hydrolase [Solirubrobacteraceae bacterium]|nr:Vms1/Ankzf1 family peptidyl-tRNA hydrolase [Solirubrobacteraceae bacterium]
MAAAVSASALERLAQLESAGHSVLSVYIDLDPSRFPTPTARHAELSALLSRAGARNANAERVRDALDAHPELVRGAHAVAIFSCAATGALEVLALPEPVEPLAVVDTVPWLEPLAAMLTTEDWGVAVLSRRAARLFRGGREGLVEFASIQDELHRRHAQGGWSQARFQRGIEQQVAEHVRHAAELLLRAHRRRPFDEIVLVASDELRPVVDASLHRDLRDRLAGVIDHDLEHAPVQDILQAIAPIVGRAERDRERALIARLEDALGTGGTAVAGLDEVLTLLEQDRVETLLLADRANLAAGLCSSCGRLSTSAEGGCPLDGAPLASVDASEYIVELAAQRSVEIVVVGDESGALREHGQVAALLRW